MRGYSAVLRTILVSAVLIFGSALGFAQPKAEKPAPQAAAPGAPQEAAEQGVLVAGVLTGGPAQKAGVARGDIILEVGETAVNTPIALQQAIDAHKAGDAVALTVRHGDAQKTLSVTLGDENGRPFMGVSLYPGRGMYGGPGGFGGGPGPGYGPGNVGRFTGAFVQSVVAGGPAEKAGIREGDVILSVDGAKLDAQGSLGDLIAGKKVGDTVTLSVQSYGQGEAQAPRDVKVTLEKNPAKDAPYVGIQYVMAPQRFGRMMPGPGVAGVLVAEVNGGSPAAKAGLRARDLITKMDGANVTDPQQVADDVSKHKPGDAISVTVYHWADATSADLTVTLGQSPGDATKAYMGISMGAAGFPGPEGMRRFRTAPPAPPARRLGSTT
jgi:S1-C subfamily serine protease